MNQEDLHQIVLAFGKQGELVQDLSRRLSDLERLEELSEPLIDYSAISTINGWSSYTIKLILCKRLRIDNLMFVRYHINGTSNSTATSFTLPESQEGTVALFEHARIQDAGGVPQTGLAYLPTGASTVTMYKNMGASTWTASGSKTIEGSFFYEIA